MRPSWRMHRPFLLETPHSILMGMIYHELTVAIRQTGIPAEKRAWSQPCPSVRTRGAEIGEQSSARTFLVYACSSFFKYHAPPSSPCRRVHTEPVGWRQRWNVHQRLNHYPPGAPSSAILPSVFFAFASPLSIVQLWESTEVDRTRL